MSIALAIHLCVSAVQFFLAELVRFKDAEMVAIVHNLLSRTFITKNHLENTYDRTFTG